MDPISSLMIQSSMISQGGFSNPDNILYSFSSGNIPFGGMIEKQPAKENYIRIREGTYQYFTLELVSQDYLRVDVRDPAIVIIVTFKMPRE
jgi:hypothetical protein